MGWNPDAALIETQQRLMAGPAHTSTIISPFGQRDRDGCIILPGHSDSGKGLVDIRPITELSVVGQKDNSWARPLLPVVSDFDPDESNEWEPCFENGTPHWTSIRSNISALRSYKQNTMASTTLQSYHIILKVTGPEEMKTLFHGILFEIDGDYPIKPSLKYVDRIDQCTCCKGLFWRATSVEPKHLKKLAHQVGVKLKIISFKPASKCKAPAGKNTLQPIVYRDWLKEWE